MKGLFNPLFFFLFLFPHVAVAQVKPATNSKKAIDFYNNGIQDYSLHNYAAAEKNFLAAIREDSLFIDAYLVLAEVYEDAKKPIDAIRNFRKAVHLNKEYYPAGFIRLANLEYKEAMYADALAHYEQYLALHTGNQANENKAKDGIARCRFSLDAVSHPVEFSPVNLGSNVNTPDDEYWPSLSADEQTLVITRLIKSDDYFRKVQEDFFISHWQEENWSVMKNAGKPLNTLDNEGAQALSGDGRFMVFTACNRSDGVGRCDLYYSIREGETWSVPKNLGKPVNTSYRETQPSLTPDGRTLYFASDRPGGKGLHDIWVTHRDVRNNWSVPVSLGDIVNTDGIEMSPFIHPDGRSLYFSSDGHIGLGGYDLFVTRSDSNGLWNKPVNLGYPINTNRDEIGLIVNELGNKAYYSSDIVKSQGKDIFMFDLPEHSRPMMVTYMKGRVFDASDRHELRALFELTDLDTGREIYRSFSDSTSGTFLVSIPANHNYMLNVSRRGYLFYSDNFALKGVYNAEKPYLKDIPLQPIQVGNSIVLKNVFYETDSYALKKESVTELNKVVRFLQTNPAIRIEISGHTDNTGTEEYNRILSENRAKTVAAYLLNASIEPGRIVHKGYGMSSPASQNETEAGKAQNRRTELKIIE
jgi:outer membrane protein OmpA-like peptidoglycan-associated protein/tetratricopeptide (TPR) repeat protein